MKLFRKIFILALFLVTFTLVSCGKKDVNPTVTITQQTDTTTVTQETESSTTTEDTNDDTKGQGNLLPETRGVWYEIFVRAFADSDGNGIGDFKGATAKLDYLVDLGVQGIWLMPINESPSYHQYDVTDYYAIDPDYGTMEDFEAFLAACEERDIKVIMDLVVNHSSSQHPWFKAASGDPNSEYRDYYKWVDEGAEGINVKDRWYKRGDQYYFAHFWDQMPDLNFDNPKVREEVKNIAKYWLEKGVTGFRMDAAMHIYTTNELKKGSNLLTPNQEWWKEFDEFCKTVNPDYYLVGEVWADAKTRSFYIESFATLFNFDLGEDTILSIVKTGNDNGFNKTVDSAYKYYNKMNPNYIDAPFLTNHDQARVMTLVGGNADKAKLAATMYLTLPGNPFIYYGEEIGMGGNKPDESIREPLLWGDEYTTTWYANKYNQETATIADQLADESSILNHYKDVIKVRNENQALDLGSFEGIETGSTKLIAYKRVGETETCVVLHNVSDVDQVISLDILGVTEQTQVIYNSNSAFEYTYGAEITVPAMTSVIFK